MASLEPAAILNQFEQKPSQLIGELSTLAHKLSSRFKLPAYLTPDDIAQEVLTVCYQKLRDGSFRGDSDIRTFVYRVTVNCCLTRQRETMVAERIMGGLGTHDQYGPSPDAKLISLEVIRSAWNVVGHLPEKCRELWRMMLLEGKNYRQVAQALDIQEVTVRERMSSCRRKAREIREKLCRDQQLGL